MKIINVFLSLSLLRRLICFNINSNKVSHVMNLKSTMSTGSSEELWEKTFEVVKDNLFLEANEKNIIKLTDRLSLLQPTLREYQILKLSRQNLLTKLLEKDRNLYMNVVTRLGNRISRSELPNLQEIPFPSPTTITSNNNNNNIDTAINNVMVIDSALVKDCALPNITFTESILDKVLLYIFRTFVQEEINYKSSVSGIKGLLAEGRYYMFSNEGTPENQHKFVRTVLGKLLTPILPPFYRIFMAGMIPSQDKNDPQWLINLFDNIRVKLPEPIEKGFQPGTQYGPWFYAPFLTSFVTPPFLSFLVGPSRINRRKDGQLGGMVVEKCKFLQESGCKGLCLHQCKLPAQQFFADTLGVPLTVSPNFETQECQWSWGEVPLPPEMDPSFPKGCLVGCPSRGLLKEQYEASLSKNYDDAVSTWKKDLCNT